MSKSRSEHSIKNSMFAVMTQGVSSVLSFVCRTVFIYVLGKAYLGFSGLFGDLLTLLSLAELGVGSAIVYSMYRPVATGDQRKIAALLNLYKNLYRYIGIVVLVVGVSLTPFLDFFISDLPDIPELQLIYLLFLANTVCSYFFTYNRSILITDQRSDIISIITMATLVGNNLVQMGVLLIFKNYIAYLVVQICFTLINNIAITIYVKKHYKFLNTYKNEKLDAETKTQIFGNVKAMVFSKISSTIVTFTDNILISKFVSTILLGLYSNYVLIQSIIRTMLRQVFTAVVGSVGNLVATEDEGRIYESFKKIFFVNYILVTFCVGMYFAIITPFITLWVGEDYLLGFGISLMIVLNMYLRQIRNTLLAFIDAFGAYVDIKKKCIAEAIINLVVSLTLVIPMKMGIVGVLLGTTISNMSTNFWFEPYVIIKKKMHHTQSEYYRLFTEYFFITVGTSAVGYYLCNHVITLGGFAGLILKMVTAAVIIIVVNILVFYRSEEFKYLLDKTTRFVKKKKK